MNHAPRGVRAEAMLMAYATLGLIAPSRFADHLAFADHQTSLQRNTQLRAASPEEQARHFEATKGLAEGRLRLLRKRLSFSFLLMASAVAMAFLVGSSGASSVLGLMPSVLGVSSVFCFAWATLGRLGWAGQSIKGDTATERLDELLFRALYWVGAFLGTLAALGSFAA